MACSFLFFQWSGGEQMISSSRGLGDAGGPDEDAEGRASFPDLDPGKGRGLLPCG